MLYVQGILEPIKSIFAEVGTVVAMNPQFTLTSIFEKSKDPIDSEKNQGLAFRISCRDCNAVYIGKTGRSAVEDFHTKKSAFVPACVRV